jgi:hypothetical protein
MECHRSREIHDTLRALAQLQSSPTIHHDTSDGGHCDVCRTEIRAGETEHIVTTRLIRVRLDAACLVIWTQERNRFTAARGPEESGGR